MYGIGAGARIRSRVAGARGSVGVIIAVMLIAACGPAEDARRNPVAPSDPAVATATAPPQASPSSDSPVTPSPSLASPSLADPVLLAAGDIAACSKEGDSATAAILARYPEATVQTLGDNAYDKGTARQFGCYHDTWGIALERTRPALGGHDYMTPGAAGYFEYFADVLAPFAPSGTDPTMGWYAYSLGGWRVIVLNSICREAGGCGPDSPQVAWLREELAANQTRCTLAVIHHPRFSSGRKGNERDVQPFWEALYAAGGEVVLSGDNHAYERLAPMTPDGSPDPSTGIRQFVVGTGGRSHYKFSEGEIHPHTEDGDDDTYGVLKLTLQPDAYSWEFLPEAGKTYTDTGQQACH